MKRNRTKRILSMLLTLCMVLTLVPMTAFAADTYTLTIVDGTKSEGGETVVVCEAGSAFNITANEAPTGKVFHKWVSTVDGVDGALTSPKNSTTWFTMPAQDVTVTATYKNDPETDTELSYIKVDAYKSTWQNLELTPAFDRETRSYALNLTSEYNPIGFYLAKQDAGQTIAATVDGVALTGYSYEAGFETAQHLTKATTVFVFTITAKDGSTTGTYTVTVNRGSGITHAVTVTGGTTATPTPAEGDTVTITANEPAPGKVFDKWTTSDGVTFANANTATTTFVMPAKAVTVTATYKDAPVTTYAVTVNSGTGGGNYAAGATVSITANAPATGKVFDKWTTSDGVTFGDANTATTTFVMPAKAVTVTATYKDISSETPDYKIIAGENGIWKKDNTKGIVIISNGDYGDFTGVNVDDIFIDPSNYTSAAGSTVVTLKPAYLETLAVGTHIVTLQFGNYSVQTNLTILAADERPDESKPDESKPDESKPAESKPDESKPAESKPAESKPDESKPDESKPDESKPNEEIPKTGDSNHTLPLIGLLLLSGSALIGVTRNKKKKKSYNK